MIPYAFSARKIPQDFEEKAQIPLRLKWMYIHFKRGVVQQPRFVFIVCLREIACPQPESMVQ